MNEHSKDGNLITKFYRCKVCNTTHSIQLNKKLLEGRSKYPFPYITMHSYVKDDKLNEFMVMLYIDRDLQIRGVEPMLGNDDFFTKEQMLEITSTLMEEIEVLREENLHLTEKLNRLNKL
mgnify:CR=1 FL=1